MVGERMSYFTGVPKPFGKLSGILTLSAQPCFSKKQFCFEKANE